MGLDLEYYWRLTPNQFKKHYEGYRVRIENEAKMKDQLNHILGMYIGFAVNEPSKYPNKPHLMKQEQLREMTDDEMERKVERLNKLFGGSIKIQNGNK